MEGMYIKNILLHVDTGCLATLVHHKLVKKRKCCRRDSHIHCVHGDTSVYPVASLKLEVGGVPVSVKSAVSQTLPVSAVLLGNRCSLTGKTVTG